jgi:hypothetical protein
MRPGSAGPHLALHWFHRTRDDPNRGDRHPIRMMKPTRRRRENRSVMRIEDNALTGDPKAFSHLALIVAARAIAAAEAGATPSLTHGAA